MGISFTEYLVTYRVNKARELLANSSAPYKEIAQAVGYTDYVQFSKMFKKRTGLTPGEYHKIVFKT